MPFSNPENKMWFLSKIFEVRPKRILDVGVGAGSYELEIRKIFGSEVIIDGIEIWDPYIERFNIISRYDNLFRTDARLWDNWNYDLVIFGDVLEHMNQSDAISIWEAVAREASYAFISIPIIEHPQSALEGNPYEIHLKEDWSTKEVLCSFPGITEYKEFSVVGAYWADFKVSQSRIGNSNNKVVANKNYFWEWVGKNYNVAINERDIAINEREIAINERDIAINERDIAINERDIAINERDIAINERDLIFKTRSYRWTKPARILVQTLRSLRTK